MIDLRTLDARRHLPGEMRMILWFGYAPDPAIWGCFSIKSCLGSNRPRLHVIASNGDGWDHVSVSTPQRTPTWAEMEQIKRLFFLPDEVAMQLHVTAAEHISFHNFTLHLWRPHDGAIPLPPAIMV